MTKRINSIDLSQRDTGTLHDGTPYEVLSDGNTCWVNAPLCVARMSAQLACVACADGSDEQWWKGDAVTPLTATTWRSFTEAVKDLHGIVVDDRHCPRTLQERP